ncbi:hypothetical protein [Terribacillus sp. DMT04]|uniref:hypothetical protein n=1 Tax=Terribacillus sp. DMT04 TaxID=2850441 RepID=UPI001C2C5558|nr:hypothetical protein [Terribacillus sp. DMT04]QXE01744.1 hypothetical protein KS242_00190 [Terribacillus sp. DMT04]
MLETFKNEVGVLNESISGIKEITGRVDDGVTTLKESLIFKNSNSENTQEWSASYFDEDFFRKLLVGASPLIKISMFIAYKFYKSEEEFSVRNAVKEVYIEYNEEFDESMALRVTDGVLSTLSMSTQLGFVHVENSYENTKVAYVNESLESYLEKEISEIKRSPDNAYYNVITYLFS